MAEESPGFLGRWARRKTAVLQGQTPEEPLPSPVASAAAPVSVSTALEPAAVEPAVEKKMLTLDDVKTLTKDSDFKPFMAGDVGPEVRNAAMKKLFADPHFNVMDGLDIYIDDYSKSDPIPEAMLRQMTSARFLKLFDEEDSEDKDSAKSETAAPRENAVDPAAETVAQSAASAEPAAPLPIPTEPISHSPGSPTDAGASQENHAHLDLRLQPDHAPPAAGAGRGTQ